MSKIRGFFCGAVRFNVLCVSISLLNRLRPFGVCGIKTDGQGMSFTVPILHAEQVKRLLRNFEFTHRENQNIIRGINYLLNHFVLAAAALVCCTVYLFADRFIYSVRIVGGGDELQKEINEYLAVHGIKKFSLKQKILQNNIAELIVQTYPTVAHANIRIHGSAAVITVAVAEYNPVSAPQNLYAKYDAVIKQIWVSGGTAKAAVGDVVKKGDLLVENAYAGMVVIIGEVRFQTAETDFIFDINIV